MENLGQSAMNANRYDSMDGGGRAASGTAAESNAGAVAEPAPEQPSNHSPSALGTLPSRIKGSNPFIRWF
jgi:hypothetical protein